MSRLNGALSRVAKVVDEAPIYEVDEEAPPRSSPSKRLRSGGLPTPMESVGSRKSVNESSDSAEVIRINDFYAYLPEHKYLYVPARALWPASAVNGKLPSVQIDGKNISPSAYLDKYRSIEQLTWHPGYDSMIPDKLAYEGGWISQPGVRTFNMYRPPAVIRGDAHAAERWRDHLRRIYPNEADHLERWFAHRLQRPGEKINHGIVLGGEQGIGKDSILEPIKRGVGPWNFQEVSPAAMLGSFNPWVRAVILRISEGHDLGDLDRFKFYDHCKVYVAAPPDVLTCNRKHMHEVPVFNVMGVVLTTNHRTDGVYLPPDDRRHFVAWSETTRDEFGPDYWAAFWKWLDAEGTGNVVAYLRGLDLSKFDAKAPPPKTAAWHAIVNANVAPEDNDLAALVEVLSRPVVIHVQMLVDAASNRRMQDVVANLTDRAQKRRIPHWLERVGYTLVPNPDSKDGVWKSGGKRLTLYGHRDYSVGERISHARDLCRAGFGS